MRASPPKIFCVNWFRINDKGEFIWPGFGDNMRVLKWMVERIDGKQGGIEHIFGVTPKYEDLAWDGVAFSKSDFEKITSIDKGAWLKEVELHAELFDHLKARLPEALLAKCNALRQKLAV